MFCKRPLNGCHIGVCHSSLVFSGVIYRGVSSKSKKEAKRLTTCTIILKHSGSGEHIFYEMILGFF